MRLTDVTLMAERFSDKPADGLRWLYNALLEVGATVQIPCRMAPVLQGSLDPARTVVVAAEGQRFPTGFTGYLSTGDGDALPNAIRACAPDSRRLPIADRIRLTVQASLFRADYGNRFARFLRRATVPVELCAHGDVSLATALTVEWLLYHSPNAVVSVLGAGGFASLAEVVMVLFLNGAGIVRPKALAKACEAFASLTGQPIPPHQPVVGSRIFHVASGVHVNGILKDSLSFEPFPPETVGAARRILLGRHTGTAAIAARLNALGVPRDSVDLKRLLGLIRGACEEGGEVTDEGLLLLADRARREASV